MAGKAGTLEQLALALGRALAPLSDRLASGNVLDFFRELGVSFPAAITSHGPFATALQNAATAGTQLPALISQIENAIESGDTGQILTAASSLIDTIKTLIQSLDVIAGELPAAAAAAGVDAAEAGEFATQLVEKLLSYTIVRYLEGYHLAVLYLLTLTGIVDRTIVPANGPTQPGHVERTVHFDRVSDFVTSPAKVLSTVYGWGDPGFTGNSEVLSRLEAALAASGSARFHRRPGKSTGTCIVSSAESLRKLKTSVRRDFRWRFWKIYMAVCRLKSHSEVPDWRSNWFSTATSKGAEELSCGLRPRSQSRPSAAPYRARPV